MIFLRLLLSSVLKACKWFFNDPKLFELLKSIRLKVINRQYCVQSKHYAYYASMIYGWRFLHPNLPSYKSNHFLSQPQLIQWILRSYPRNKFLSKDPYIMRKKKPLIKKNSSSSNIRLATFKRKKWLWINIFLKKNLITMMLCQMKRFHKTITHTLET